MRITVLLAACISLAACATSREYRSHPASASPASPTSRDDRMAWFRDARFGLFIHWGLYAIPAGQWNGQRVRGTGEWIQTNAPIQVADYEKLRDQFNPVKFDARAWARAAKQAGMKYVVITSKHHDGFALFDSAVTEWDVMASPFKRDILKELADACRAEGLRICWYHSIMDWHHPDYLPRRKWEVRPADGAEFDRYETFMRAQLKELLTNYGKIGILWFDGEWEDTWTHERGKALDAYVRSLQPDIIINNRVDKGRNDMAGLNKEGDWAGDYGTPEQEVPATGMPGVDWESCMTMNDTWGFRADDHNWKSSTELIRTLCDIVSKGGNFLLNVGPTAEGLIPEPSLTRLADIGRWMDANSEAIYGTHAGPFPRLRFGRCSAKPGALYLHVFDWPADGLLRVPGLRNRVTAARILGSGEPVRVSRLDDDVILQVPAAPLHDAATVIALSIVGEPDVVSGPIRPGPDGRILLDAADAEIHGQRLKYESKYGGSLGFWTSHEDYAQWSVQAPRGMYQIVVDLSCIPEAAGSEFVVETATQSFTGVVPSTGSWGTFTPFKCEVVEITSDEPFRVVVRPGESFTGTLMNLRVVRLIPTDEHDHREAPGPTFP
ncbi:MAG: hypothetical protein HBSAPP03_23670 [Phycisphaerae bacterium]|nr:MAG: hypothetical protein HBSAPP03_23670 [Phycisphaerae bacterium]